MQKRANGGLIVFVISFIFISLIFSLLGFVSANSGTAGTVSPAAPPGTWNGRLTNPPGGCLGDPSSPCPMECYSLTEEEYIHSSPPISRSCGDSVHSRIRSATFPNTNSWETYSPRCSTDPLTFFTSPDGRQRKGSKEIPKCKSALGPAYYESTPCGVDPAGNPQECVNGCCEMIKYNTAWCHREGFGVKYHPSDDGYPYEPDTCANGNTAILRWNCVDPTSSSEYYPLPVEECTGGHCESNPHGNGPECVGSVTCGNGVPDSGEQCDDGNTVSGDGCSSSCQTETTGCPPGQRQDPYAGPGIVSCVNNCYPCQSDDPIKGLCAVYDDSQCSSGEICGTNGCVSNHVPCDGSCDLTTKYCDLASNTCRDNPVGTSTYVDVVTLGGTWSCDSWNPFC